MSNQNIGPAMTPEEWGMVRHDLPLEIRHGFEEWVDCSSHRIAAECLYGQPFGFTWEDVDLLKLCSPGDPDMMPPFETDDEKALRDLADRIAALLPPREENE